MEVEKLKGDCDDSVSKGRLLAKWLTKYIRRRAKELKLFKRDTNTLTVEFDRVTLDNSYKFYIKYMPKYEWHLEEISYLTISQHFSNSYYQSFYPTGNSDPMLLGRYNRKLREIFSWGNLQIRLEERKEQIWK